MDTSFNTRDARKVSDMKKDFMESLDSLKLDINDTFININDQIETIKVRLSPSRNIYCSCFNKHPLKMIVYFILKAIFVLKISSFFFGHFGHVVKKTW